MLMQKDLREAIAKLRELEKILAELKYKIQKELKKK